MTGSPLDALSQLNRALLAQRGGALCSVAAMTLSWPEGTAVEAAVAGHPPPLLISDGAVTEIALRGPVLGAFDDAGWELEQVPLSYGEQLVVYTDGVTEARSPTGASARSASGSACARSGARRRRSAGSTPTSTISAMATSTTTRPS